MKVYHGGFMAVEKPKILKSKFPKDFTLFTTEHYDRQRR